MMHWFSLSVVEGLLFHFFLAGNSLLNTKSRPWSFIIFVQTDFPLLRGRNGIPVRPNGRNVQTSPDGSLILNNVKPSDEGTYTCNAYTGIYSVSATAEVRITKDTQQGGKREQQGRLVETSPASPFLP